MQGRLPVTSAQPHRYFNLVMNHYANIGNRSSNPHRDPRGAMRYFNDVEPDFTRLFREFDGRDVLVHCISGAPAALPPWGAVRASAASAEAPLAEASGVPWRAEPSGAILLAGGGRSGSESHPSALKIGRRIWRGPSHLSPKPPTRESGFRHFWPQPLLLASRPELSWGRELELELVGVEVCRASAPHGRF